MVVTVCLSYCHLCPIVMYFSLYFVLVMVIVYLSVCLVCLCLCLFVLLCVRVNLSSRIYCDVIDCVLLSLCCSSCVVLPYPCQGQGSEILSVLPYPCQGQGSG